MQFRKCLTAGLLALGVAAGATAQFTGPAPLAWRWSHSTSVSPMGSPVVDGKSVYVAVGNRMFALDKESGNQKWRFPLVEGVPGYFRSAPVFAEGVLAASADNGLIYGVDAATGQSKWQYPSPVPIIGQPVAVGRYIVFQMSDNTLMAINASDGMPAWTTGPYHVFAGVNGGLAAYQDTVIYATQNNDLVCLSVNAQRQLWSKSFSVIFGDSTPILYGENLYLNSGSYVVAVSALTGTVRWQQNVGEQLAFSPAVSPLGVFVASVDGNGYLFDPASGRPKLKKVVELKSSPCARPSPADAMFVAPTSNGALNLIDPATGEVVWSYLVRPQIGASSSGNTGGRAGGGAGPGGPVGGGAGGNAQSNAPPLAIPAAGGPVLAGQTLLVLMQDASLLAFDKGLGVDKTGPAVKMLWPNPGDQVSGQPPLQMIFKIDDEATGVNEKTLSIMVEGLPLEFEYGRDGYAVVRISMLGKNKPLFDGRKEIVVTVSDWMGNRTVSTYALTIDNTLPALQTPNSAQPNTGGPGAGGGVGGGRGGGGIG